MLYVDIDISKFKHDFVIINKHGLVIVPPKTIPNSLKGFNELLASFSSLDRSQVIKIGFEATGHYHKNILSFLSKHGFQVIELNPLQVSKFHS